MNSIAEVYNELLNKGVSVLSLYIYSILINDERSFNLTETQIDEVIDEIINRYYDYGLSVPDAVERVLDDMDTSYLF